MEQLDAVRVEIGFFTAKFSLWKLYACSHRSKRAKSKRKSWHSDMLNVGRRTDSWGVGRLGKTTGERCSPEASLCHPPATIDGQRLPGDIAGQRRGKKHHRGGYFLGLSRTAQSYHALAPVYDMIAEAQSTTSIEE